MKSIRFCIAVFLLAAMPLVAGAAESGVPERIVLNKIAAVINGEIVTLHELRRQAGSEFVRMRINPSDQSNRREVNEIMSKVLSVMIDDMLLRQEAERLQIKVTDADVDNEMRMLIQRNQTSEKEFEARVVAQGGTMEMLRERIKNSILSQRITGIMIARKIVITPEEISTYYDAHRGDFQAERSVDFSLIVFSPSSKPQDTYNKITAGTLSFEEAAEKFSEGPAPDKGGRLGMIQWDDLAAPFKAQILRMKDGDVSELFMLNNRECLLKLNGSTSGRNMTLEEATPEIERVLREPRMEERFVEYTQQLRSKAVIDIRL